MPETPFALTGIIYDTDGATAVDGATVRATNLRSGEELTDTTESDGSYSITFETYLNNDPVVLEATYEEATNWVKYAFISTTIDTGLAGRDTNITLDKHLNKSELDKIITVPVQDRQDLMFSPQFNALRVLPTGFNKVQTTFTRDSSTNLITRIEEDDGLHTKVTTITRDADNFITSIAERIE